MHFRAGRKLCDIFKRHPENKQQRTTEMMCGLLLYTTRKGFIRKLTLVQMLMYLPYQSYLKMRAREICPYGIYLRG